MIVANRPSRNILLQVPSFSSPPRYTRRVKPVHKILKIREVIAPTHKKFRENSPIISINGIFVSIKVKDSGAIVSTDATVKPKIVMVILIMVSRLIVIRVIQLLKVCNALFA
jgi:hypothetical protein